MQGERKLFGSFSFVNGGTCVGSVDGTNSDVRSVATFIGVDYERVTDETQRG